MHDIQSRHKTYADKAKLTKKFGGSIDSFLRIQPPEYFITFWEGKVKRSLRGF